MTAQRKKIPVIFLHGFTGSSEDWFPILENIDDVCTPLTIDLVGHGTSNHPRELSTYTIDAQIARIKSYLDKLSIDKFMLAGYSMGGRIALRWATSYPEQLCGLILESAVAGIEDETERQRRIESDEELARFIESNDIETFIDRWMNLPLFASQSRLPDEIRNELRTRKLKNSKHGLANTLRAAGAGQMQPLWEHVPNLSIPVLLITGSIDEKFTDINIRMAGIIPDCKHVIIDDAGHNVHLEKPKQYYQIVKEFIANEMGKR